MNIINTSIMIKTGLVQLLDHGRALPLLVDLGDVVARLHLKMLRMDF